jgi:hypothetical protein
VHGSDQTALAALREASKDPQGNIPEGDIQGLNLLDNAVIDRPEIAKETPSGQLSDVVTRHP